MSPPHPEHYRFEVALSFASDDKRDQVRAVAEALRCELGLGKVFFAEWFEAELAGHDAQTVLQRVYRESTRLVVTCVCRRYNEKPWTQDEWRAIQAFERNLRDAGGENRKRMRLLPLRFGDGDVDGIFETAIVPDVRGRRPDEIARLILERLRLTQREASNEPPLVPRRQATSKNDSPPSTDEPVAVSGAGSRTKGTAQRWRGVAFACALAGSAAGILQARVNPPPASAWFEMTLIDQGKANPMNREGEAGQFAVSVEAAFRSLRLIKKTMEALGVPDLSDADASSIQQELSFEKQDHPSQLWRGQYRDVDATRAAQFLKKHLDVYVETEIDKTLNVFRTSIEFLANEVADVKLDLRAVEAKLLDFRDKHPEAVPKDAMLPSPSTETRAQGSSVGGQLDQTNQEINSVKSQLTRGTSLARGQLERSKRFDDQVLVVRGEIAEAKARGMTDQHPDVQRLRSEEANLMRLAAHAAAAEASEAEKRVDQETLLLRERLAVLTAQQQQLQKQLAAANKRADEARTGSLRELQADYQDLSREYEAKRKKHDTIVADLESKRVQLELAHASARASYDIITPPTPAPASMASAMFKRGGVGGAIGLLLALAVAVVFGQHQRFMGRQRA